jgi:hypothetical protein
MVSDATAAGVYVTAKTPLLKLSLIYALPRECVCHPDNDRRKLVAEHLSSNGRCSVFYIRGNSLFRTSLR